MSNQDYADYLFLPNALTFFSIFTLVFIFFVFWFWRNIYSWLDPFLLAILYSATGLTTVIFLFVTNNISDNYFIQTLLSQFMLMIGYKALSRNERGLSRKDEIVIPVPRSSGSLTTVFVVSSIFFIFAQLCTYILLGIPLLMENRLMVYQSGGYGVLGRIIDVTIVISFYSFMDMKLRYRSKRLGNIYGCLYIIFLIVSLILNGSKSGILNLVFIVGIFCYINKLKFNISLVQKYSKISKRLFIAAILSMLIILMTNYGVFSDGNYSRIYDLVGVIFMRVFNSGDIYVLSYPNDALFNIQNNFNGFVALFKDVLATFRLIATEEIPPPLGNVAFNIYSNTAIGGANARQSLFGYYYFGFSGSLLFSFILGIIMSFVRHVLPRMKKPTPLSMGVVCYFILNYSFLDIDPSYQFSKITNFLIVLPLILLLTMFISKKAITRNV